MTDEKTLDTWAIIELFGHSKIAGRISEVTVAGGTFLRVDVPTVNDHPGFTRDIGANAIYSITYVDEAIACRAVEAMQPQPVTVYDGVVLPERQLSAPQVKLVPDDEPLFPDDDEDAYYRQQAIHDARDWIGSNPLFLDIETTGLDRNAQICDIAVVELDGTLLDTLVKPTIPIPADASSVHGITDEDVADAPTFAEVLPGLRGILGGNMVVVYNVDYDRRLIEQSAAAHGLGTGFRKNGISWRCAMETYAMFHGDWSDYHESYRWQKLGDAARQCGLDIPTDLHRACADADLTRQIVIYMANSED